MVDMRVVKLQLKILAKSPDRSRCHYCGKRMKFARGGLIGFAGREEYCRSCGREQPALKDIIELSPEDWALIESFNPDKFPDLPECLGCGVKLQVSRDGTKVFCMSCRREWERFEFEDILERAIPFEWLGMIPLEFDQSRSTRKLQEKLDANGIDSSTPFMVAQNYRKPKRDENGKKIKRKWSEIPLYYVALYADYIAEYEVINEVVTAKEYSYASFVTSDDLSALDLPFEASITSNRKQFYLYLTYLVNSYLLNLEPYKSPELFGTAARDAALAAEAAAVETGESLSAQLGQLFELHKLGALTDEEYAAAKAKLLG
ncbi:MAG: SHOCT domain-containing protein [Actinomycetes bacterium]